MPATPKKRRRVASNETGSSQTSLIPFLSPGKSDVKENTVGGRPFLDDAGWEDFEQIEADHKLALELQRQFETEDAQPPAPNDDDRGSRGEYSDPCDSGSGSQRQDAGAGPSNPDAPINDDAPPAPAAGGKNVDAPKAALSDGDVQSGNAAPRKSANGGIDVDALDAAVSSIELDTDIFTFDPLAIDTAHWPVQGGVRKVPYILFANAFAHASSVRSRLQIQRILTNLLRIVRHHDPASLTAAVYLMSNHVAPSYEGVELGLGPTLINRVISQVSGRSAAALRKLWHRSGDPGDVAFEACKSVTQLVHLEPLTASKVVRMVPCTS